MKLISLKIAVSFSLTTSIALAQLEDATLAPKAGWAASRANPFSRPQDDEIGDRAHTPFERLEREIYTLPPQHVDSDARFSAGTVSVSELRQRLSHEGAVLILRAQQFAASGKHIKAIETLKQALKDGSSAAYARTLLGVEYLVTGDLNAAIVNLKEAVVLMPALAANHANLGYALCKAGSRSAGERELREALQVDHTMPKPHFVLGIILLDSRNPEAREHLRFAENVVARAPMALAVYYQRAGADEAVKEELQKFLELNRAADPKGITEWVTATASLAHPAMAFGFPEAHE